MKYFIEQKHCFHEIITWHKTNPIPTANGTYLPDTEYCLMFREKGTKIGGSYETKSKYWVSGLNKADKDDFEHPTIKPLEFVKHHIINSTNKGDIVFDCFVGSGTTCVACKELERKYVGIEINEKYWKIATDRLNGINQKGEMNIFETDFDNEQEKYEQMSLFEGKE